MPMRATFPRLHVPSRFAWAVDLPAVWFRRSYQLQHVAEYVLGPIVSSRFSVQADPFTGHRRASAKGWFMDEAPWSPVRVMRRLVRLAKEHAGFSKPSQGFLFIDDTILEHDMDTRMMEKIQLPAPSFIWHRLYSKPGAAS